MKRWSTKQMIAGLGVVALLAGCTGAMADSPDEMVSKVVGKQNRIYVENQPVPLYDYSAQRDAVIQLYNATIPKTPNTWTVFYEFNTATDMCVSKGYGIPFGVSLTSPEYERDSAAQGSLALPQPEPSGLYTNTVTSAATWVLCVNDSGAVEPVYAEGNVRVYSHPVSIDENGRIVHEQGDASVTISVKP